MLNAAERHRTRDELQSNLALSGLALPDMAADLDFSPTRLQAALDVDGAEGPADVWLLRDYLEQAVRDRGHQPVAFTVLTEDARRRARSWFALREAPRHVFSAGTVIDTSIR